MVDFDNDTKKRLIINLDVALTSTIYELEICGSFEIDSAENLTTWPISVYLQMTDFPRQVVSTVSIINFTQNTDC
jgi:hypothetical protein